MPRLSPAQRRALYEVLSDPGRSAHPGLSLGTLLSLERRGLVRGLQRDYMWSPRTHVHWHATDAGRAAYEEDEPCQSS